MVDMAGVYGQQNLQSGNTEFNAIQFMIQQSLAKVNTAMPVQVVAVNTAGRVAPIGTVDVLPLINQMDGIDQPTPHVTVFGLPYIRQQGGLNAVIIDPKIGDVGICVFCDHDISAVKNTGLPSNPGSRRRFSMSDGVYIGCSFSKLAPLQYLLIDDIGVTVEAGSTPATLHASQFTINCNVKVNGTFEVSGPATLDTTLKVKGATTMDADATISGKHFLAHVHPGVTVGTAATGVPL